MSGAGPPAPSSGIGRRVSIAELDRFVCQALERAEVPEGSAEIVAEALVTTDAMGISTHGTKLLAGYLKKLLARGYRPDAIPRIEREGPAWGIIDGDGGLGQIGCRAAVELAMRKASQVGVAHVGLRNTGHIGAAGFFASFAARNGFVALVTGNDIPSVTAPGARRAVLGSNPLAWAAPTSNDPIVLDIATAAVAGGKVYAARMRGEPIPASWLVDADGLPTTDASLYPDRASLAPMAGHKGYGLGLFCELLAGVLPGGRVTWEIGSWIFDDPSLPSGHNASFTLWDPAIFASRESYLERIDRLANEIRAVEPAVGSREVLLPGDLEWRRALRAAADGILLPPDVVDKLDEAATLVTIPPCDYLDPDP